MKIKERIKEIIVGLQDESVRYPRMKTTDVIYILSNVVSTVYEDENPIIPQSKQETIEEVAQKYAKEQPLNKTSHMMGFLAGAKHQSEKMFSNEEVMEILNKCGEVFIPNYNATTKKTLCLDWLTQHKKH